MLLQISQQMHRAKTLTDEDLSLAPLTAEHVSQEYVRWLNDPSVVRQTEQSGTIHTARSLRAYVDAAVQAQDSVLWRILLSGQHIGNLRLSGIHEVHCRASLGLLIGAAEARGKGLGPRVISLATRHAFEDLRLNKVFAGMFATNEPSRRAFENAGYCVEATLRNHAWHDGRFVDVLMMARFSAQEAT